MIRVATYTAIRSILQCYESGLRIVITISNVYCNVRSYVDIKSCFYLFLESSIKRSLFAFSENITLYKRNDLENSKRKISRVNSFGINAILISKVEKPSTLSIKQTVAEKGKKGK